METPQNVPGAGSSNPPAPYQYNSQSNSQNTISQKEFARNSEGKLGQCYRFKKESC